MQEIDYMFPSSDTQIQPINIKVHCPRFEIEIRHFLGLELSAKGKP
jgi:hypothetical protein